MFILISKYLKPIEEVEKWLDHHIEFLNKYYAQNKFIVSGRQVPGTGGVIICNVTDREELAKIMKEDPFCQQYIAEYEITEFNPRLYAEAFKPFITES